MPHLSIQNTYSIDSVANLTLTKEKKDRLRQIRADQASFAITTYSSSYIVSRLDTIARFKPLVSIIYSLYLGEVFKYYLCL